MYEKILSSDIELYKHLNGDMGWFMDNLMVISSSKITLALAIILSLIYLFKKVSRREFIFIIIAILAIILVADQTCNIFKINTPRFRPMHEPLLQGLIHLVDGHRGGASGTVSAHAANSFGVLIFLSLIIRNFKYTIGAIVLCLLISYSRIYLGYHYSLDLFYGTTLGITVAFVFYKIYTKTKNSTICLKK